ncbi:MAG: hypothetical protein Q7J35_05145 [Candidatus Methanoperedens sp.]|nr:hypothetical protein [Candidatus Methanoperedens sp.]
MSFIRHRPAPTNGCSSYYLQQADCFAGILGIVTKLDVMKAHARLSAEK